MRTDVAVEVLIFPHSIRDTYGADVVGKVYNVSAFSTTEKINVIKYGAGYAVAYWDDVLKEFEPDVFVENLIGVFSKNLNGYNVCMRLVYLEFDGITWEGKFNQNRVIYDQECALAILRLNNEFAQVGVYESAESNTEFKYSGSPYLNRLYEVHKKGPDNVEPVVVKTNPVSQDPTQIKVKLQPEPRPVDDPVPGLNNSLMDYYSSIGLPDYEDEFDDKKKKKRKKRKNRKDVNYGISKVIKAANSPKKAYRRHGVLVCSEKDAIRKDEKIIKAFLKDFIPGHQEWKKEFRKELSKRWIQVYVITKKQLKRLEKDHQHAQSAKRVSANVERTIDFTRKLFNTPIDHWNDPSR